MVTVEEITIHDVSQAENVKKKGNEYFSKGELQQAVETYQEALTYCSLEVGPKVWSAVHNNIAACYIRLADYEKAVEHCTKAFEGDENDKIYYRRAQAREKLQKYQEAKEDLETLLSKYPNVKEADMHKKKIKELDLEARAQAEHLKEEMLGKLKDLGNMVLRPFGLSTDSFQLSEDGKGGMSISMKQQGQ